MHDGQDHSFDLRTLHSINEVPAGDWNKCTEGNPFVSHAFLAALESTGCASTETGWQPLHIQLLSPEGSLLGFMPLYAKSHSQGEYVFDHNWAAAYERAGGRYYPKLQASVPFSPVNAPKLLLNPDADKGQSRRALLQSAAHFNDQVGTSSLHLTFLPNDEMQAAKDVGYLIRKDQQFHWHNNDYDSFEDFLTALSSRKRKQIRKERRTALQGGIKIICIEGQDITEVMWDAFYNFYTDTGSRKWGQPYLNRAFFSAIGTSMPENIVLFLCVRDGEYVAGALNLKGPDTLYGRYWGCIEDHPCLHFETCYYQAIDYAIKHNLKLVEAGAQGAHKLARGYEPTATYSAHWIRDPGFRDAIAHFLAQEHDHMDAEIDYLSAHTPFKKG